VLVVQSNDFNDSRIQTVIVAVITSNLSLAAAPGNVLCKKRRTGLSKDSVVNISQLYTIDKRFLTERIGTLAPALLKEVESGLRLVLSLESLSRAG
jgi:mRNA interferase MazF